MTDELQANQNLLWESQQKADHLKGLIGSLQEQVDTHKQQVGMRTDTLYNMPTEYIHAGINTRIALWLFLISLWRFLFWKTVFMRLKRDPLYM